VSTPLRERPDAPLGTLIFRAGLLPAETIESALEEGVKTGKRLGEILTERGLISEVDLARLLAGQRGLDFVTLREQIVDPAAAALFTEEQARLFRALPYSFDGELPVVAIADPTDEVLMRNIREALGRDDARFVVSARGELAEIATDVYSRPLPTAADTPPAEPEPEPEAEAEAPVGHTNGAGHADSDLLTHAAPVQPEPEPERSALPEPEPEPAAFEPEPEPAVFEPEPEPAAEPPALQRPGPAEPAGAEPAAPPLPEPLPAALAEPFPAPAVEPVELPEPAPLETPQPVAFEVQSPPEQPTAPEPVAEAQAPSEPAGYSPEPPAVAVPLRIIEPAPAAPDPAPALEPPAPFDPPASAEPVPLPQPPAPPPTPYPPAAVQPEPAPVPAPEQPAAAEPPPGAPSVWRLSIRLTIGERVEGGDFPDEDVAKQEARTIMALIADADSGEWPFVNGRFLKPDTIVSVDIAELAADDLT
jgi:Type II secretion system (T2SS), protein E, N-terminal domain